MINIDAPITLNQFDEKRYTRIEQSIAAMQQAVAEMQAQLQEVLNSRQAQVDAAAEQLKKQNDALELVVKKFTEQQ